MVRRSLRAALGLVVLLIGGAAAAQPVLVMTDDKRRLEIASLSLEYEAGQVQARVTSARGGTLEAEGTWKEGLLALQFTAHDLDAETVEPWLLRAGPLPVASGTLTGTGTLRWKSGEPVRIEHSVTHTGGEIEWLGIRFRAPVQTQGEIIVGGGTRLKNLRVEAAEAMLGDLQFTTLNSVVHLKDKQVAGADVTLTLDRATLDELMLGLKTLDGEIEAGDIAVEGNLDRFKELLGLLDAFEFWFAIVTP